MKVVLKDCITIAGTDCDIPELPYSVRILGFRSARHVQAVANANGKLIRPMRMRDVVDYWHKASTIGLEGGW